MKVQQITEDLPESYRSPGRKEFSCVVVEKFAIGFQADHVILVKVIQFQKHLIIIIASIHGKRCFSKEVGSPFYGLKSNPHQCRRWE